MLEKGGISVETKHIFPIIKRWLYSEKEIFLRELISNACDAVTKMKRLLSLGEVRAEDLDSSEFKIIVELNEDERTVKIIDNGIGMNAEEIKKYITQIALSGALDFIEKYENSDSAEIQDDTAKNGIIGHFGLGFYSSFMVADKVDIRSKSYAGGSGVFWTCTEEGSFELSEDEQINNIGTEVILHINEENAEFLSEYKIKDILEKYCAFMPVEIYFKKANHECEHKDGEEDDCACKKPVNDIAPLWTKNPSSCEKEEYPEFYRKLFKDYKDPLFYIHINADYPLNFKGILYFPRLNNQFDSLEGQVKLYYNQVFVADNIKEVIPEYLLMLKGVVDCPELPLNVSRSYLQNSGYVSKISAHIVKKVADKLSSLFHTERENYEKFWQDINTFVLYGCLRDQKFYDRVKDIILYKNITGEYKTLSEITGDKDEQTIYYTNNPAAQAVYVSMKQRAGHDVFILENMIENQFINLVETKDDKKIKFARVDSEIADNAENESENYQELTDLFKEAAGNRENLKIEVRALNDDKIPAVLTLSEEKRRMADMIKQYKSLDFNMFNLPEQEADETLVINSKNALIQKLAQNKNKEAAEYIYMLSLLSKRELTADELEKFIERGVDLCGKIL